MFSSMLILGTTRYWLRKKKEKIVGSLAWETDLAKWDTATLAIGKARLEEMMDGLH